MKRVIENIIFRAKFCRKGRDHPKKRRLGDDSAKCYKFFLNGRDHLSWYDSFQFGLQDFRKFSDKKIYFFVWLRSVHRKCFLPKETNFGLTLTP